MTDEIKKMLEPFQRSFILRGDPCDKSSWTWDVYPPPEAFWDDDIYVSKESYDRLKRGFFMLMAQRNKALSLFSDEIALMHCLEKWIANDDAELEAAMKGEEP